MYDAFISYNEKDADWVETILQPPLERAGLRLCLPDRDFALGVPRLVNMENAIAQSRKTLLILTAAQAYEDHTTRQALIQLVRDQEEYFAHEPHRPTPRNRA